MDNRILLEIELRGKEVLSELQSIENILNNINKKTFKVTLTDSGGVGKILQKMQEILEQLQIINHMTISPKVDTSGLDRMTRSAKNLNSEIQQAVNAMTRIPKQLGGPVMTNWFAWPNGAISGGAGAFGQLWRQNLEIFEKGLWSNLSRYMSMSSWMGLAQNVRAWINNYPQLTHSGLYGSALTYATLGRMLPGNSYLNQLYLNGPSWATKLLPGAANWYTGPFGTTRSYEQMFNPQLLLTGRVSDEFSSLGKAVSSVGSYLGGLDNNFIDPFANRVSEVLNNWSTKLSGAGSIFMGGSNLLSMLSSVGFQSQVDTVISTITSQFTGSVVEGISNAFTRYDVFIKYPRIMDAFGISISESSEALNKLNDAVLGLPTSLNDIASSATDFVAILSGLGYEGTELLDTSTDLAIAVNNAVLASGASDSDAQYAVQQIQNLIGTGGLTAIQWRSLRRTIPVALSEISKELGFSTWVEMRDAFTAGKISVKDFTDALIRLGTNGGPLAKLADISKLTFEAIAANFRNAFSRLIAGRVNENGEVEGGLLGTLNQLTMDRFGQQLPDYIKTNIIPRIDAFALTLENAVLTHGDEIFNFIDRVLAYDWEGLIGTIARFTALKWDLVLSTFEKIPQGLIGFASSLAGPASMLLRFLGSIAMIGSSILGGVAFNALTKNLALEKALAGATSIEEFEQIMMSGATSPAGALAALAAFVVGEQGYLWYKATRNTGGKHHNETLGYISGARGSIDDISKRYQTIGAYAHYLPGMTDTSDIIATIAYLNENLPGINLRWDEINKKITVNGDLIDDLPTYLDEYIAKLQEADKVAEAIYQRGEISGKIIEARENRDEAKNALIEALATHGFNPADFFDENGNILSTVFSDAIVELNALDALELTNLRSQFELAKSDVLALEKEWRAFDNMIKLGEEEWAIVVEEFRAKYGEIPEEIMTMIEDGTVTIPTNMEELVALCAKAVKEGRLPEAFLEELGIAADYITNDSAGIVSAAGSAGDMAGDAMGSNFFNKVKRWLDSIFPLMFDLVDGISLPKYNKTTGIGVTTSGSPGPMRKPPVNASAKAFGGRVQRIGGNSGDTVLTWLTPGEYVVRKHAVDKIGLDTLNKFNSFNFKGALDALSERVGSGMSPYAYAGGVSNTRIYNNNAQATIHVNNASQEFTQRRASKWVRGLK